MRTVPNCKSHLCSLYCHYNSQIEKRMANLFSTDMLKKVGGILKRLLIGYMNMHVHDLMVWVRNIMLV